MRTQTLAAALTVAGVFAGITLVRTGPVHGASKAAPGWDRAAAAHFLDQRETWWQDWPRAQKDHGTVCISCHTQVPYAMVRPGLRRDLGETALSAPEQAMLASVEKRVTNWSEMTPFYTDEKNGPGKTVEAHNTEAVLNAIILSSFDQRLGHLRPITVTAFDHAWALQETTGPVAGSWTWQNFHLGPWEGDESGYQTSALLLIEARLAPDEYAKRPDVLAHLNWLRAYLQRGYETQPLLNKLYVLWASRTDPGLLSAPQRKALIEALAGKQQADGGWNSFALDPCVRKDQSPAPTASDGYATGLAVIAMEDAGANRRNPLLQRAVAWLAAHQNPDGTWTAESINKHRNPDTDPALFMTDAATAYAVLALDRSN
jgi:hypothetical protein